MALLTPLVWSAEQHVTSNVVMVLTPTYIAELSEQMRRTHPGLKAAEAKTNSAHASIGAVKTWEDPRVRVGGMIGREMMRADDGDILYGAEQSLPLFGRPRAERSVARAELRVSTADLEYRSQLLRADLAKTLFRASMVHETVSTMEQDLVWLRNISKDLDSRYGAGQATLIDVLQAKNELGEQETELETARAELKHWHLALNRLLGKELEASWPQLRLPEPGPRIVFGTNLTKTALKFEPRVLMMKEDIRRGEAALDLTRKQRLPDVMLGVEGRNYSGNGDFRQGMVFLSMSVPWLNSRSYESQIRRDAARVRELEYELEDYRLDVQEEIHDLTVRADAARRKALLYKNEIEPRTASAMQSSTASWASGKSTFTELLTTRRTLLSARLSYKRAVAEQYEILSDLVLCCGLGDLQALEMFETPGSIQSP